MSNGLLYNRSMVETRSSHILIRVQPSLKALAEKAARDDSRSLSSLIEKLLTDHLRAKGDRAKARPR